MTAHRSSNLSSPFGELEKPSFNWFPGHMAKAKRELQKKVRFVDLVVEIVDARAPMSTRNLEFNKFISNKPRILLLNKCDLADGICTSQWIKFINSKPFVENAVSYALVMNSRINNGKNAYLHAFFAVLHKFFSKKVVKIMIVGIPNVGKSCFINLLLGKNVATVQNKAAVTASCNWYNVDSNFEVLDTPGIFPTKFSSKTQAENLAFLGTINDNTLDQDSLATRLIDRLRTNYLNKIVARYNLNHREINSKNTNSYEIINQIAQNRAMLISGNEIDFSRASKMLLKEFRDGKIGRISLEAINFGNVNYGNK